MKVKIWNDGPADHVEEFLGDKIVIPRGEFILMPRSKAIKFMGTFRPFTRDGNIMSQGLKQLRMEEDAEAKAAKYDQPFSFMATDGTKFRTKQGLKSHEASLTVISQGSKNVRKTAK
ncbi:hypothetical protein N8Z24_00465 [bacterium]|nr:hypothetical protein [bacterium]